MDRKAEITINDILEKISPREQASIDMQGNKLLYSVIGFISATDFTDNGIVLSNLGYVLGQSGLNTCIVDFKVFYPNLYQYLDVPQNKRGRGLLNVLKSDKVDIRDEINVTKYEKLFLLTPSPQDLMEEYFDFDFSNIETVIETLKKIFDVVLIDIPNIPPLEFCMGAMKYCHMGFFTASERIDAVNNMTRLLDFANTLGISTAKFVSVIYMNLQETGYDFDIIKKLKFNIVAALPIAKGAITDSYEGRMYIRDNPLVNRYFEEQINNLAQMIIRQG